MIESLIKAEKECSKRVDLKPDKVLQPIGATFKEWSDCISSTDAPHWVTWKVIGYIQSYRGRRGDTLFYERMEEIELV